MLKPLELIISNTTSCNGLSIGGVRAASLL